MKASELRIGNWVFNIIGNPFQISKVTIGHFDVDQNGTVRALNPIPLTEEWLLKFGFDKSKKLWDTFAHLDYWQLELEIDNKRIDNLMFRLDKYGSVRAYTYDYIKHVHQLQNLYFALTGEELTIK